MSEFSLSDEVVEIPLRCDICGEYDVLEGEEQNLFEVAGDGEELREDEWYLHLFDEGLEIENGVIVEGRLVSLCPDCAPETPLTGSELDSFLEEKND